ncbi:hypothetical protein BYT27DRAFT_7208515 [Phlegmacium glaucopus]|nr:hypothetical protein BYT27DRAFT_7208515 [Phlegmacium glaucopus]
METLKVVNVQQVKRWFQNQSRTSSATTRLSLKKNMSLKQVTCHVYKAEIASIAERRANGAKPGSQEYFPFFQGAITEFMDGLDEESRARLEDERDKWLSGVHPLEVKRKAAQGMGQSFLEKSAQTQYNENGDANHDYNENHGKIKVQSFEAKYPEAVEEFKAAWVEYMAYCYEVESGEQVESVAQSRATTALIELERDVKGFPLLPNSCVGDTLAFIKKLIRSFITAHYRFASRHKQDRVPWKHIKEHTSNFIDDQYLPEPLDTLQAMIEDPSDMKKERITQLLEHWRRPVPGSDLFRFSYVLVNNKSNETMPALYKISPAPQNREVIPTGPIAIDEGPSLDWDTEYNDQPLRFTPGPHDDENMEPSNDLDPQELESLPPNPVLEAPLLTLLRTESVPSKAPTPIIDPQLIGLEYTSPPQSPVESTPPDTVGQIPPGPEPRPRPRPRPRPKGKTPQEPTAATMAATEPEPELGRTKRIAKRRLDLYEVEEMKAAERAEKKARDKQETQAKRQKRK